MALEIDCSQNEILKTNDEFYEENENTNNNNLINGEEEEDDEDDDVDSNRVNSNDNKSDKTSEFKRIMYTKEFLLLLQNREHSKSYPVSLPKFCTNIDGFWDPEKYFDLMRIAKIANQGAKANDKASANDETDSNTVLMSGDSSQSQYLVQKASSNFNNVRKTTKRSKTNLTFKNSTDQLIINCNDSENRALTNSTSFIQISPKNPPSSTSMEEIVEPPKLVPIEPAHIIITESLSLNPGSIYEVVLCSINLENNFYVNTVSLLCALQELTIKINDYCNQQQQMYIKANINDLVLAKSITDGIWYRSRVINSTDAYSTVFAIDNGKTFETVNTLLLPCPQKIKQIPPFAINIGLAGLQLRIHDTRLLADYLKKQSSYKIKILFFINDKYYVELLNDNDVSLNSLLNPRFQNDIYGTPNSVTTTNEI